MKFSNVFLAAAATFVAAKPLEPSANALNSTQLIEGVSAGQIVKCNAGSPYCGWVLIDRQGWDPEALKTLLCQQLGRCDRNSGDVWNTVWFCQSDFSVVASSFCGGADSCAGPTAHCR